MGCFVFATLRSSVSHQMVLPPLDVPEDVERAGETPDDGMRKGGTPGGAAGRSCAGNGVSGRRA